jgi:putative transposase
MRASSNNVIRTDHTFRKRLTLNDSGQNVHAVEKLRAGITSFLNNELLTKGQKTAYGQAASFPKELLEQYISETEEAKKKDKKVKAPNIASFITWAKAKLYTNFGRKVQLFPTPEQEKLLLLNVDAYRWTYNFLYAHRRDNAVIPWRKQKFQAVSHAWFTKKAVREIKFQDWKPPYIRKETWPTWMKTAISYVVNGCCVCFPNKPSGFRSKHNSAAEFVIHQGDHISIMDDCITMPKIGNIKHSRPGRIPTDMKVCSIGISCKNGKWYAGVSLQSKKRKPQLRTNGRTIGIDVGCRRLATAWNGEHHAVYNGEHLDKCGNNIVRLEKDKARWQRKVSRRYKSGQMHQSKRFLFAKARVASLYGRISDIRVNNLHQISHRLLGGNIKHVCIEKLDVAEMMGNSKKSNKKQSSRALRRILNAACMGRLLSYIRYKSGWRGIRLTEAIQCKEFASSKLCNTCGGKNYALGGEEYWICPTCNTRHQRDENASKNMRDFGIKIDA